MVLLTKLADYLIWANDSIWEVVKNLSDEEFRRPMYESGGSLHIRYVHLAEDTWEWFHDWNSETVDEPDFLGLNRDELYSFITKYVRKWIGMIKEREVDEFQDERAGKVLKIQFDEMFFHMVNHFTYHRGQIVMALKVLGKEVPMTDYVPHRFSIIK